MNYGNGHIAAIAKSEEVASKLLGESKNVLFVDSLRRLFCFQPENEQICLAEKAAAQIERLDEYDVAEWYSESRFRVSKLNYRHMDKLAEFIVSNLQGTDHVTITATEMCGAAAVNRDKVWIDYADAFKASKAAIKSLMAGGIDVRLYNFPLCKVERGYWSLCWKSISDHKIRYYEGCQRCGVRDICGGVFGSTLNLTKMRLNPI